MRRGLKTSAPELAALLVNSNLPELARQYRGADAGLSAQSKFRTRAIRANQAVLATATGSALLTVQRRVRRIRLHGALPGQGRSPLRGRMTARGELEPRRGASTTSPPSSTIPPSRSTSTSNN